MLKRDELTDPKSCMSRARDDEMTFVLLGRDVTAAATVQFWINQRVECGKNVMEDSQIGEALERINTLIEQATDPALARQLWYRVFQNARKKEHTDA